MRGRRIGGLSSRVGEHPADGLRVPALPAVLSVPTAAAGLLLAGRCAGCLLSDSRGRARHGRPEAPTASGTSLDVVSLGESSVVDEARADGCEGEEVFWLAFVATVEPAAAGEPGHGPFDDPSMTSEPL